MRAFDNKTNTTTCSVHVSTLKRFDEFVKNGRDEGKGLKSLLGRWLSNAPGGFRAVLGYRRRALTELKISEGT